VGAASDLSLGKHILQEVVMVMVGMRMGEAAGLAMSRVRFDEDQEAPEAGRRATRRQRVQ
jgi:hypothetical protein